MGVHKLAYNHSVGFATNYLGYKKSSVLMQ